MALRAPAVLDAFNTHSDIPAGFRFPVPSRRRAARFSRRSEGPFNYEAWTWALASTAHSAVMFTRRRTVALGVMM